MSANDPTVPDEPRVFRYDGEVRPSEKRHVRFEVSETYLGAPVEVSVTIVNGSEPGPRVFCTAAVHGDELNGVKVCQELARRYDPADLAGTLVVVHVVNVPAFHAQQRYIPIYDLDLNRSFPGQDGAGNTAERMAAELWEAFLSKCDVGLDFHTSTRNRTTMFHTRADVAAPGVERLAKAFGTNVVLAGGGDERSLRAAATRAGIPTVTVEMGKAHRFQPVLTEKALDGVASVLAEYDLIDGAVSWPSWFRVVSPEDQKAWLRADEGGLVDMRWGPYPLVRAGETICTVTDHFSREEHVVEAPFTGLLVGVLENPVALPGHPLCHLVSVDEATAAEIDAEIRSGEFDGYRANGGTWRVGAEQE